MKTITPQSKLKMSVITFVGLWPLVLFIPPLVEKLLGLKGFNLITLSTVIIVLLMTYWVMPGLMKLAKF
ncbi:hypothetical protein A9Q84_15110 [Halobacteriovorax marinus]|uniref:Uncharacterized protein n=1 Tax=Halobacteriovorax marinus TaxID=97084 RepID=A0A1Y5F586_9BACT|nr:hypothetical protein A9Q84_15110 [Halobacteriovorax marinus]